MKPLPCPFLLPLLALAAALTFPSTPTLAAEPNSLPALVRILSQSSDPQVQIDILRGLRDAFQGRTRVPMPPAWPDVESRLHRSDQPEIRALSRTVGLTFGSPAALQAVRDALVDASLDAPQRQDALRALVALRDDGLAPRLRGLLSDPAVRAAAIRALAAFDDPETAPALLRVYPSLPASERRDVLSTLAARPASARALLDAIPDAGVQVKDLTAEVIRQLRNLKNSEVDAGLTRVYGSIREVSEDKKAEIDRYKRLYYAGGSTPGDAIRGRTVYARICQQCHTLFEVGGKVGPDLTGSNRGDLDYLLQNILDPNAVIPNEYVASTVELQDGRVLTGILQNQDDRALTIATANETLTVPRSSVVDLSRSQLSMMPEGLLAPLADQEYRDLVYYLGRPGQAPLLATPDTVALFFNGRDLAGWHADDSAWRVDQGELVAVTPPNLPNAAPSWLVGDMIAGDFSLAFEARFHPDSTPAALFLRAEPSPEGGLRGPSLLLGAAQWGQLALNPTDAQRQPASASPKIRSNDWNLIEINATGTTLRARINGLPVAEASDPSLPRQGIFAFRLDPAPAGQLRLRNLRLDLAPKP